MSFTLIIYFLLLLTVKSLESNLTLTKLAFGSCSDFVKYPNIDIFSTILSYNPHLFFWLGDFAYIDNKFLIFKSYLPSEDTVVFRFLSTKNHSSYQKMLSAFPIIGIWDDHDYGQNDGNKYNPHKNLIQQLFLDFLDVAKDSPRRNQSGIYFSYKINQNIKIILLDVRFNKESWFEETQDMLGQEQWDWLAMELNETDIDLFFLASGTQFMPDDRFFPESWFRPSKQRLYDLIGKSRKRVVLLSGDVHYGEIMKLPCSCETIGFPLFEMTSSGMTHHFGDGYIIKDKLANFAFPDTFSTKENRYFGYNFGSIEVLIDSNNKTNSKVTLQIRDINNNVRLEQMISFKDLEFKSAQECLDQKEKQCILSEAREMRFLKNALRKVWNFDLYIYSVIMGILMILVFILSLVSFFIKKVKRILTRLLKSKKE